MNRADIQGFTLIELSIVLVIIGLIVGGILVGQDLIKAAEVRAQISQIEKYNSAVNTFRGKFGAIPGDMSVATANQFGFTTPADCTGQQGGRDGNGLIDGYLAPDIDTQSLGEPALFWQDVSSGPAGRLIEGTFPNSGAGAITCGAIIYPLTTSSGLLFLGNYFPFAKIARGNFVYVYETSGSNWYGVSAITAVNGATGAVSSNATISVMQAYNMDKKTDDGLATTGTVRAMFLNGANNAPPVQASNATTDSTTTCYNTTSNAYSISSLANYGAVGNCALSFRFQ